MIKVIDIASKPRTRVADGFFHSFSGWVIFTTAFLMLIAVHQALSLAARGLERRHA